MRNAIKKIREWPAEKKFSLIPNPFADFPELVSLPSHRELEEALNAPLPSCLPSLSVYGPPGCGKSIYVRQLAEKYERTVWVPFRLVRTEERLKIHIANEIIRNYHSFFESGEAQCYFSPFLVVPDQNHRFRLVDASLRNGDGIEMVRALFRIQELAPSLIVLDDMEYGFRLHDFLAFFGCDSPSPETRMVCMHHANQKDIRAVYGKEFEIQVRNLTRPEFQTIAEDILAEGNTSLKEHEAEDCFSLCRNNRDFFRVAAALWEVSAKDGDGLSFDRAARLVMARESHLFRSHLSGLTTAQLRVLETTAMGWATQPLCSTVLKRCGISQASSLDRCYKALLEKGLIYRDMGGYHATDIFMKHYMENIF